MPLKLAGIFTLHLNCKTQMNLSSLKKNQNESDLLECPAVVLKLKCWCLLKRVNIQR